MADQRPASGHAAKPEDVRATAQAAVDAMLRQDTAAAKHLAQLAAEPTTAVKALAILARHVVAALEVAAVRSARNPADEWADVAAAATTPTGLIGIAQYELAALRGRNRP